MTTADFIFGAAIAFTALIMFYQGWRVGFKTGMQYEADKRVLERLRNSQSPDD
jgi:hypothetical protein